MERGHELRLIMFSILAVLLAECSAALTYQDVVSVHFELTSKKEVVNYSIKSIEGFASANLPSGDYSMRLYSGSVLTSTFYIRGGQVEVSNQEPQYGLPILLNANIPYPGPVDQFILRDKEGKVIINTSINFCNSNGACEKFESLHSCLVDCPANVADQICIPDINGVCDPDCAAGVDADCTAQSSTTLASSTTLTTRLEASTTTTLKQMPDFPEIVPGGIKQKTWLFVLLGAAIIIVLLLALLPRLRKKEPKEDYSDIGNRLVSLRRGN